MTQPEVQPLHAAGPLAASFSMKWNFERGSASAQASFIIFSRGDRTSHQARLLDVLRAVWRVRA